MNAVRRQDSGFTLIEILVSLAIMGLVLPIVLMAFTNGARSRAVAANRTTAAYLLRDKITEMEATGVPEVGDDAGEFEAGTTYTWQTSVATTDIEGLYDVTVAILWTERGEERSFSIRLYMADPAVSSSPIGAQGAVTGGGAPPGG
jgi:type II secretion system protein I